MKYLLTSLAVSLSFLAASLASAEGEGTKVKIGKGGVSVETGGTKVKVEDPDDEDSDSVEDRGAGAQAAVKSITGNNLTVTHVCGGPEKGPMVVNITGNNHTITLSGACTKLTVTGNGHKVTVEEIGSIQATGNNLSVGWKKAQSGDHPQVKKVGNGIKVYKLEK